LRKPIFAGNLDRAAQRWYESRVAASAVALLAEVPLFAELEPAELELIVVAMHERTFSAGETVTEEGEPADGFYLIASGEAEATVRGEPVATMRTGDHFGEIALLMGAERTATIKATTQLDCYGIAPGEFRALVEGNPTIAWKLMGSMSDRLA
jgi:CRP-like cAMP-binding protein